MHDLVIRNGHLVDGLGNPGYAGDIAVDGDTISALGHVTAPGKREIDADGLVVTPGFVDLHTHLDAQIGWDPALTPASWHGVTTALMGNCGVTFAPVRDDAKETLAGMMESVEDIPRAAILEGLPWDWSSYGQYLDSIEKLNPAINVCGLVGHAATRFYVMGERAVEEQPSTDEIVEIAELAGRSVRDGAIGFSINRLRVHVLPDGRPIPGTFATTEEFIAIARAVGAHGGMLQSVIQSDRLDEEMALMHAQLKAANTRLLFSAPWTPTATGENAYLPGIEAIRGEGFDIVGTTQPRAAGFLSGLKTNVLFGMRLRGDTWRALRGMDPDERLAAIRDDDFRRRLVEEAAQMEPADGIGQTMMSSRFSIPPAKSFWMGTDARPNYTQGPDGSLAAMADAAGETPVETWLRLLDESNGEGLFHIRFVNENLDPLPEFMRCDWVVPGVGDAGAHVGVIMDAGWTSFLLSHWYRDQQVFSLEESIEMLTSKQMRVLGFADRGSLTIGHKADINVLDVNRVEERQPVRVTDFPGGAARLIQRAVGYRATIANGAVILEDDELTGARAGRVLRNPSYFS